MNLSRTNNEEEGEEEEEEEEETMGETKEAVSEWKMDLIFDALAGAGSELKGFFFEPVAGICRLFSSATGAMA